MAKKNDLIQAVNAVESPAGTYTNEAQTQAAQAKRRRKRTGEKNELIPFTMPQNLLAESRRLAHYRQQSHSSFLEDVIREYIDTHRDELTAFDAVYEQLGKAIPNPTE